MTSGGIMGLCIRYTYCRDNYYVWDGGGGCYEDVYHRNEYYRDMYHNNRCNKDMCYRKACGRHMYCLNTHPNRLPFS